MSATIVRKWEYKGMMLEVKHIRLLNKEAIETVQAIYEDFATQLKDGHYCGYVTTFSPVNDVYALDVHGGITFEEDNADGSITYGFDCAHAWDTIETWDIDAVSQECQSLANQIRKFAGIMD